MIPCSPLRCDGVLTDEDFQALFSAALCTVGQSPSSAAKACRSLMPKTTARLKEVEEQTLDHDDAESPSE
jgi:hypothetical protein